MPFYKIDDRAPSLPADGSAWVAPSADIIGDARIGRDASIWFGAVIRADNGTILIGERTNIQDGAILHSDPDAPLKIGADCTVGHRAVLHGCTIGDGVLVGMGAVVLNNAVIGDGCLIGAGALVTEGKNFPPGSLIVGSPARVARSLDNAVIEELGHSAAGYVARQRQYAGALAKIGRSWDE